MDQRSVLVPLQYLLSFSVPYTAALSYSTMSCSVLICSILICSVSVLICLLLSSPVIKFHFYFFIPTPSLFPTPFLLLLSPFSLLYLLSYHLSPLILHSHPIPLSHLTIYLSLSLTLSPIPSLSLTLSHSLCPSLSYRRHPPP